MVSLGGTQQVVCETSQARLLNTKARMLRVLDALPLPLDLTPGLLSCSNAASVPYTNSNAASNSKCEWAPTTSSAFPKTCAGSSGGDCARIGCQSWRPAFTMTGACYYAYDSSVANSGVELEGGLAKCMIPSDSLKNSEEQLGVKGTDSGLPIHRICCCKEVGEVETHVCPVDATDCPANCPLVFGKCNCGSSCAVDTYWAGWGGNPNGDCLACAPDTHLPAGAGASECIDCAVGTYYDASGGSCVNCPAGKFTKGAVSGCLDCTKGRYTTAEIAIAVTECTMCGLGQFTGLTGATECKECPLDFVTGVVYDSSECIICAAGKVRDGAGIVCSACAAGTYKADGRTNRTLNGTCVPCTMGKVSSAQSSACELCVEGRIANSGQTACEDPRSNLGCTPGQVASVVGMTASCKDCTAGSFSPMNSSLACTPCIRGKFSNTAGASSCAKCPRGRASDPLNFLDGASNCSECLRGSKSDRTRLACEVCPIDHYLISGQDKCEACPSSRIREHVTCRAGILTFSSDVVPWYAPLSANETLNAETKIFDCFTNLACVALKEPASVICDGELGYTGPLCGACDEQRSFVRSGRVCSRCQSKAFNAILVAGIVAILGIVLVYTTAFRKLSRRAGEYGGVIRRLAFSYLQMLGVLGVFKARGTRLYNEIVGETSEVAGGGVAKIHAISCLSMQTLGPGALVYAQFLIQMLLPVAAACFVAIVLIPTYLVSRGIDRRRKAKRLHLVEFSSAELAALTAPSRKPQLDVDSRCWCGLPYRALMQCSACTIPTTPRDDENWLRRAKRQRPHAPLERTVIGVKRETCHSMAWPVLFSMKCCRLPTTEDERAAWRVDYVMALMKRNFHPGRRFVSVMVLVVYSLYPTLVSASASIFNCTASIQGKRYLVADLNQICYEGAHLGFIVCAGFGLALYCIGVPLTLAWLILFEMCKCGAAPKFSGAATDVAAQTKRLRCYCKLRSTLHFRLSSMRERFGLLVAGYDTSRGLLVMAWEPLVVMLRKLCVTLAGVFPSDPTLQLMLAILILVSSLTLQALVQPYESTLLNVLDTVSLASLVFTQVVSILYLYFSTSNDLGAAELERLEFATTTVLLFLNAAVIALLFGAFAIKFLQEKLPLLFQLLERVCAAKRGGSGKEAEATEMVRLQPSRSSTSAALSTHILVERASVAQLHAEIASLKSMLDELSRQTGATRLNPQKKKKDPGRLVSAATSVQENPMRRCVQIEAASPPEEGGAGETIAAAVAAAHELAVPVDALNATEVVVDVVQSYFYLDATDRVTMHEVTVSELKAYANGGYFAPTSLFREERDAEDELPLSAVLRIARDDGLHYTHSEFIAHYGASLEWDAAAAETPLLIEAAHVHGHQGAGEGGEHESSSNSSDSLSSLTSGASSDDDDGVPIYVREV